MTTFAGFPDAERRFFEALARRNERDGFLAHKAELEAGWNASMKALVATA